MLDSKIFFFKQERINKRLWHAAESMEKLILELPTPLTVEIISMLSLKTSNMHDLKPLTLMDAQGLPQKR